jgi:hypothetical protein
MHAMVATLHTGKKLMIRKVTGIIEEQAVTSNC